MELSEVANAFGALAQGVRLELLRTLLRAAPDGIAAGALAARMGLAPSTLSFHLATLEAAGLTRATRHGRMIVHAAQPRALRRLRDFLNETCGADHATMPEEPAAMTAAFNVLFLCTHNAARSIMAEALLQKLGGARFRAYSAGSHPTAVLAEVAEKLRHLGHDTATLRSKSWQEFATPTAPRFDFVITLCDTLRGTACPDFGPLAVTAAWPLPDPAKFTGNARERAVVLNELYASLRRRIEVFTALPFAALDRAALRARLDELAGFTPGMVH